MVCPDYSSKAMLSSRFDFVSLFCAMHLGLFLVHVIMMASSQIVNATPNNIARDKSQKFIKSLE